MPLVRRPHNSLYYLKVVCEKMEPGFSLWCRWKDKRLWRYFVTGEFQTVGKEKNVPSEKQRIPCPGENRVPREFGLSSSFKVVPDMAR